VATYDLSIPIGRLIQKVFQDRILVVELSECTRNYGFLQLSLLEDEKQCKKIMKRVDRPWREHRRTTLHVSGSPYRLAQPTGSRISKRKGGLNAFTHLGFGANEVAAVGDTSTIITHGGCRNQSDASSVRRTPIWVLSHIHLVRGSCVKAVPETTRRQRNAAGINSYGPHYTATR